MSDVPLEEAVKIAEQMAAAGAVVTFKFTCEECGTRCYFDEPNTWYENGECFECGHITRNIKGYGLMVSIGIGKKKDAAKGP